MNKKLIRLTESDLHRIVKESVNRVLNEIGDTPKGQMALGGLHARKVLRNNDLSDDTYNYAQNARGGDKYDNRGNNENPLYHEYANGYIDYLNSHPDEYMVNKRKRMSESYLHRIVKESVNRILGEDQEGYNQVMSTLNNPTAQKGLKKAWNKERKRNPNADYDTFEYNHALNLQNKKRKEDERYATVKESVNRIINEIGDTPRGQYMLGRLSQSYGEPDLYSDDYDKVPEIADYASRNWRKDGNARAFDLGKGDEANTKWVDDGNQRNFRKMYNLPQFENKQNKRMDMNKKIIRLTESDLHKIVKESVNRILNEVEFRGRTFHGNIPDDWRKIAHIRNAYRMDADKGETDAINGYNHSFDSQDAKEAEYWRNASKKHSKNADRDMNNYRDMSNQ